MRNIPIIRVRWSLEPGVRPGLQWTCWAKLRCEEERGFVGWTGRRPHPTSHYLSLHCSSWRKFVSNSLHQLVMMCSAASFWSTASLVLLWVCHWPLYCAPAHPRTCQGCQHEFPLRTIWWLSTVPRGWRSLYKYMIVNVVHAACIHPSIHACIHTMPLHYSTVQYIQLGWSPQVGRWNHRSGCCQVDEITWLRARPEEGVPPPLGQSWHGLYQSVGSGCLVPMASYLIIVNGNFKILIIVIGLT